MNVLNKMWYLHPVKYYSVLKGKEILTHYTMEESQGYYAKWNKSVSK